MFTIVIFGVIGVAAYFLLGLHKQTDKVRRIVDALGTSITGLTLGTLLAFIAGDYLLPRIAIQGDTYRCWTGELVRDDQGIMTSSLTQYSSQVEHQQSNVYSLTSIDPIGGLLFYERVPEGEAYPIVVVANRWVYSYWMLFMVDEHIFENPPRFTTITHPGPEEIRHIPGNDRDLFLSEYCSQ